MRLLIVFSFSLWASAAAAAVIDLPPFGYSNHVAANVPAFGNTWTGVAQSFTAEDANVFAGFSLFRGAAAGAGSEDLLYRLYQGDGTISPPNLLAERPLTFAPGGFGYPSSLSLAIADFTDTPLSPGSMYTLVLSLASGALPPSGAYSETSAAYASIDGVNGTPYAGGRFYFTGSPYDASFPLRDVALHVNPVPLPATIWLLGSGLTALFVWRRNARFAQCQRP